MKRFKNRSLRFRLVLALLAVSLSVWAIATVVEWYKTKKEVHKLFDTQQVLLAERLASSNLTREGFREFQPELSRSDDKHFDDDALALAIFNENGIPIFNDGRNGRTIPFSRQAGFQNIAMLEEDGDLDQWRIYWLKHNNFYIAVGQELEYREDLLAEMLQVHFSGWFVGIPLLILAIGWIVSRELAPLTKLSRQITQRKPDEMSQIEDSHLPQEILPLVGSLNHYFERTQQMLKRERRFTSDAAHELRSPLASLRIQTEIAQLTKDDPIAHQQALNNILLSIDRTAQLIEQLLTLSRLENMAQLDDLQVVNWQQLISDQVSELYVNAERKQSEILVEMPTETVISQGKPLLLSLVIRNLLDNAIGYTPNGSQIFIHLTSKGLVLEDNGNGVSEADLQRLGQPFYRPADRPVESEQDQRGSGLGLSIVKRILALHSHSLHFQHSERGGLRVEIRFD